MKNKSLVAIVSAGILAGTGGIFIKYIQLSPGAIVWMRTFVPAFILLFWMIRYKRHVHKGKPGKLIWASLLNAIRIFFFITAFVYTSIGNAAILFYSYPIFTTLLGIRVLGERISKKQLLLLSLTFLGMVIAYGDQTVSLSDRDFLGMVAAVTAAVFYSITVIIFKSEAHRFHQMELIFFQNLIAGILFLPFFIMEWDQVRLADLGLGVAYALVIGLGVFGLFFYSLKSLQASTATAIMYLEVASAILLSYLVFGEVLSLSMIIGGAMIIISSFLITRVR